MSLHVLVAGAAGSLGRHVIRELAGRGHRVRALIRRTLLPGDLAHVATHSADALDPAQLEGCCQDVDAVFSCLGASVLPQVWRGRRSFHRVDTPANRSLIDVARRAGVGRFVYVSVAGHVQLSHLRYVQAHEAVVETLRDSGVAHSVIRPTGFFSALGEMVKMGRIGFVPLIGDGSARTNPIHDADLAVVCADAVETDIGDRQVGGPETLTRRGCAELALRALGKKTRTPVLAPGLVRAQGRLIRPLNPRVGDLVAFFEEVFTHDLVVPAYGTRMLEPYFAELVEGKASPASARGNGKA